MHLAKARGLRVIATGGTEDGRKMLKDLGLEHVLNHREEGYIAKVKVRKWGKKESVREREKKKMSGEGSLLDSYAF